MHTPGARAKPGRATRQAAEGRPGHNIRNFLVEPARPTLPKHGQKVREIDFRDAKTIEIEESSQFCVDW